MRKMFTKVLIAFLSFLLFTGCRDEVKEYYKVDDLTLENIALARNWILKGSEPDIERTAIYVLKDFREGRLGLFILDDLPQD